MQKVNKVFITEGETGGEKLYLKKKKHKDGREDAEQKLCSGERRGGSNMLGMIKNSLFGNTEETVYKLLSSETKVSRKQKSLTRRYL